MSPPPNFLGQAAVSRRDFLRTTALAGLAAHAEGGPHRPPRARRIVWLMQNGGPSHVDLFDPKPELVRRAGDDLPDSVRQGQRLTTMTSGQKGFPLLPPQRPFRRFGQSGTEISSLLPYIGSLADRICLVRSMHTDAINHAPAVTELLTGHQLPGRPSLGAWLAYALGSDNADLPAFIALTSRDRENSCGQLLYDHYWGSGFLPSQLQGVKLHGQGDLVPFLSNPPGVTRQARRALLHDLATLNAMQHEVNGDPETLARSAQYDLAHRMQASVPELVDTTDEPPHVLAMYGPDVQRRGSFANNCLLARRLLERGVRCVQLMHAGWDQHNNISTQLAIQCHDTDQPSAALVLDLLQRGLLDDTLVVWGGEFGRTPFCQGDPKAARYGRDHHGNAFSIWLAGAGVRAGSVVGATDAFGYNPVDRRGDTIAPTKHAPHADAVHVHDLQATLLHLLGIDHERLTYVHQGRRYRLTDVFGRVMPDLLA